MASQDHRTLNELQEIKISKSGETIMSRKKCFRRQPSMTLDPVNLKA